MIAKLRVPVTLALTACGALITRALAAQPAFADHESRDQVLSESGREVLLIALVLVAAIAAMGAFAAGILWWERQDSEASVHERRN